MKYSIRLLDTYLYVKSSISTPTLRRSPSTDKQNHVRFDEYNIPIIPGSKLNNETTWLSDDNFILLCLGNIANIRNFTRFSKYCPQFGGITFIFAYLITMFIIGIPLLFIEIIVGQYTRRGTLHASLIVRGLNGIGYSQILLNIVYIMDSYLILTRMLTFIWSSVQNPPVWSNCNNTWNDKSCFIVSTDVEYEHLQIYDTSSSQYIFTELFHVKTKINNTLVFIDESKLRYYLLPNSLPYLFILLVIFLLIETFKLHFIYYVSQTSVILFGFMSIILVNMGVTLTGSGIGLKKLIIPKFDSLYGIKIWQIAVIEVLSTYRIGYSNLLTISCFNRYESNIKSKIKMIVAIELILSFISSVAIIEVVGYMQLIHRVDISNYNREAMFYLIGTEVFYNFSYGNLFLFSLFLIIFLQQLNTQVFSIEVINLALFDKFNILYKNKKMKMFIRSFVYIFVFIFVYIITVLDSQFYMFTIIKYYCLIICALTLAFCQSATLCYIYGIRKVERMFLYMCKDYMPIIIKMNLLISPVIILCIICLEIANDSANALSLTKFLNYPFWTPYFGYGLCVIVLCPIPIFFIYDFIEIKNTNRDKKLYECIELLFKSHPLFGRLIAMDIIRVYN